MLMHCYHCRKNYKNKPCQKGLQAYVTMFMSTFDSLTVSGFTTSFLIKHLFKCTLAERQIKAQSNMNI
jgi:hypothetical protein